MEGDVGGFHARVEDMLRGWVVDAEIRRRISEPGLIRALTSGAFLPLASTGTSDSGVGDANVRADDELRIFGIELDAPGDERPIYGYLEGSDESCAVRSFGPIVLGLHASVRRRATFVLGDTRDSTLVSPVFAPVPLLSPRIDAVANTKKDLLQAQTLADACEGGYRYAEVQVHCGLSIHEITRVVYTGGVGPSERAEELLRKARLSPVVIAGDDPGPPGC